MALESVRGLVLHSALIDSSAIIACSSAHFRYTESERDTIGNYTMTLSPDQLHALEGGQPVLLTVMGTPCIVVRQDVYERTVSSSGEETPRDSYAAVLKALDACDEDTEQYLAYLNETR